MFEGVKTFFKKLLGAGNKDASAKPKKAKPKKYVHDDMKEFGFAASLIPMGAGKRLAKSYMYGAYSFETNASDYDALITRISIFDNEEVVIRDHIGQYAMKTIGEKAMSTNLNLRKLIIPEGIVKIESDAFSFSNKLEEVYFPSTLKELGPEVFQMCSSLRYVVIPQNVTTIGGNLFALCERLEKVVVPTAMKPLMTKSPKYLGILPDMVEFKDVDADNAANMVEEYLSKPIEDAVKIDVNSTGTLTNPMSPAEIKALDMKEFEMEAILIDFGKGDIWKDKYTYGNYTFETKDNIAMITFIMPMRGKTLNIRAFIDKYVVKILGSRCLPYNESEKVVIPNTVEIIMEEAMPNMTNLKEICFSDSVKTIERDAFKNASSLQAVAIPKNVKEIGVNIFDGCDKLEMVVLPTAMQSIIEEKPTYLGINPNIIEYKDVNATTAQKLVSDYLANPVKKSSEAAASSGGEYPHSEIAGLKYLGNGNQLAGPRYATEDFEVEIEGDKLYVTNCYEREDDNATIDIPSEFGSISTLGIGTLAINNRKYVEEIVVPDTVKYIADKAISNNKALKRIYLPDSLEEIGSEAFSMNPALAEVVVPCNVKKIGKKAFYGADGLKHLVIPTSFKATVEKNPKIFGCSADVIEFKDMTAAEANALPTMLTDNEQYEIDRKKKQDAKAKRDEEQYNMDFELNDAAQAKLEKDKQALDAEKAKMKGGIPSLNNKSNSVGAKSNNAGGNINALGGKQNSIGGSVGGSVGGKVGGSVGSKVGGSVGGKISGLNAIGASINGINSENKKKVSSSGSIKPLGNNSPSSSGSISAIGNNKPSNSGTINSINGIGGSVSSSASTGSVSTSGMSSINADSKQSKLIFDMKDIPVGYKDENGIEYLGQKDGQYLYLFEDYVLAAFEHDSELNIYKYVGEDTVVEIPGRCLKRKIVEVAMTSFEGNANVEEVIIPNTVSCIGAGAFQYCSALKKVFIPAGVTRIEGGAFRGCTSLTEIEVPSTVSSMHPNVFDGCFNLKKAVVPLPLKEFMAENRDFLGVDYSVAEFRNVTPKKDRTPREKAPAKKKTPPKEFIYHGFYPQSLKADSVKIVDRSTDASIFIGDDGERYAHKDGNYYKFEPIRWRVVSENALEYVLVSDKILDSSLYSHCEYDDGYGYDVISNTDYSSIEPIVNGIEAKIYACSDSKYVQMHSFNDYQDEYEKNVIMSLTSDYNDDVEDDTDDFTKALYIPNMTEIFDQSKSVDENIKANASRVHTATDYAGDVDTWWLRQSPYGEKWLNYFVNNDGSVNIDVPCGPDEVNTLKRGIVLMMHYRKDPNHKKTVDVSVHTVVDGELQEKHVEIPYGATIKDANLDYNKMDNWRVASNVVNDLVPWFYDNPIYSDIALIATPRDLFKRVVYHMNGGGYSGGNPYELNSKETVELVNAGTSIFRENGKWCIRKFAGWYYDAEFKSPAKTIDYNHAEVYAKWGRKTYIEDSILRVNSEGSIDKNGKFLLFGEYPSDVLEPSDEALLKHVEGDVYIHPSGARYVKHKAVVNEDASMIVPIIIPGNEYYYRIAPVGWLVEANGDRLELTTDAAIGTSHVIDYFTKDGIKEKNDCWSKNPDTDVNNYSNYSSNIGVKIYEIFKQMFDENEVKILLPCGEENYENDLMCIPSKELIVGKAEENSKVMNAMLFDNVDKRAVPRHLSEFSYSSNIADEEDGAPWYLRNITNYRTTCISYVDGDGNVNPFSGLDTIGKAVNMLDDSYGLVLAVSVDNKDLIDKSFDFNYVEKVEEE